MSLSKVTIQEKTDNPEYGLKTFEVLQVYLYLSKSTQLI